MTQAEPYRFTRGGCFVCAPQESVVQTIPAAEAEHESFTIRAAVRHQIVHGLQDRGRDAAITRCDHTDNSAHTRQRSSVREATPARATNTGRLYW